MENNESRLYIRATSDTLEDQVLVGDITRLISSLVNLFIDGRVGNLEFGKGLEQFVERLRPFVDSPVSDLIFDFADASGLNRDRAGTSKSSVVLLPTKSTFNRPEKQTSVENIIRFVSGLAELLEDERTGNLKSSSGLQQLARVLSPFAAHSVSELIPAVVDDIGSSNIENGSMKPTPTPLVEPEELDRLDLRLNQTSDTSESQLLGSDISRILLSLAALFADERIGNMESSRGLEYTAQALHPYADSPVSELSSAFRIATKSHSTRVESRKFRATLPDDLESLSQEEVKRILGDRRYTKQQIAELGHRRFGMSRSSLIHNRKDYAAESVRAALDNERSHDIIYEEAQKGGTLRSEF